MSVKEKKTHSFTMRLSVKLHEKLKTVANDEGFPLSYILLHYIHQGIKADVWVERALDATAAKIAKNETTGLMTLLGELKDKGEKQ